MTSPNNVLEKFPLLSKPAQWPKTIQLGVVAAIIAMFAVAIMWTRGADYKVLFSNLADRDGGAIVTTLTQMNIAYKFSDNGSAILIPADQVYETRLLLAEQGLPKGGESGFELLDKTRFGASQFTEQVNYQRALEGELSRSIEALNAVQAARVHLAIPRETLFVRDRKEPTASVLVTLYAGRTLSENQIAAITWLVSSSVPHLNSEQVSIVDQNGRLMTNNTDSHSGASTQRSYIIDIEQRATERILNVLSPIVGSHNVRAQVSASVDFSQREQTSEVYGPNQHQDRAAVRSKQTSFTNMADENEAGGIPGALTNQAPLNPVAPLVTPPNENDSEDDEDAPQTDQNNETTIQTTPPNVISGQDNLNSALGQQKSDATINYEVDRTISHVKDATGKLNRLSAAVVINYRMLDDELVPLEPEELAKIDDIVKKAMGFDDLRGDNVSIINSPFTDAPSTKVAIWENLDYIELAMQIGRYLLILLIAFFVWRKILKPIIESQTKSMSIPVGPSPDLQDQINRAAEAKQRASEMNRYEDNIQTARNMAEQDPRAVAMVVRSWMESKDDNRG